MLALFDLDNTLIDRSGGLEDWARTFVRSRRLPRAAESVVRDRLRDRAYPADFVLLRTVLGLGDDPGNLWREYVAGVARSVRPFPGVKEGLEGLRRSGWTLGIATNGAGDIQRAKLDTTRLAPLFDGICVSEEVGVRKPERRLFEAAATACGVELSAGGWMIGDNPVADMDGARAAGLRTVWVANGRAWPDGLRKPVAAVHRIAEGIELLREIED
ncbi:HAD family hydrolase [Streptomyces sp. NPDC004592]